MNFKKWLNGWRRIGVVLVATWLGAASFVLWVHPDEVVRRFPDVGKHEIGSYPVPAPELKDEIEASESQRLARPLEPWKKEWNPVRWVRAPIGIVSLPSTTRLLILIIVPILAWILVELLAATVRWIGVGFSAELRGKG